jgi:hypothetical protein
MCSDVPSLQHPQQAKWTELRVSNASAGEVDIQCHQLEQGEVRATAALMQSNPSPSWYHVRRRRHPFWHPLASRSFYSASSISMILVNKSLDKRYEVHCFSRSSLFVAQFSSHFCLLSFAAIITTSKGTSVSCSLSFNPSLHWYVWNLVGDTFTKPANIAPLSQMHHFRREYSFVECSSLAWLLCTQILYQ